MIPRAGRASPTMTGDALSGTGRWTIGPVDKNAGSGPDGGANQQPGNLIMGLLLRRGFRGATR